VADDRDLEVEDVNADLDKIAHDVVDEPSLWNQTSIPARRTRRNISA
jgi:hypothetical protein